MKQVTPEKLAAHLKELLESAQNEAVLVVRDGRPSALIIGVEHRENCDAEDWDYMTDPEFWRAMRERRKEAGTVSLDQVRARLAADEQKEQHDQTLAGRKA